MKHLPVDLHPVKKVVHVHAMKAYGGEWSTTCPGCFTPRKRTLVPIEKEAGWVLAII